MRYLLVTHIPFARRPDGYALLDRLWAEDLRGLAASLGPVTVAAPEHSPETLSGWGTGFAEVEPGSALTFLGLPPRTRRVDPARSSRLRTLLRAAVDEADLVHTSNLFEPDTDLYAAHDYAVAKGKQTLFVVAEDFHDMLSWEWVRTAPTPVARWRRERSLARVDRHVRSRVANASLTFLHTPAAVERYRLDARNAVAIRQPVHEVGEMIALAELEARLSRTASPLKLVTASRLRPMKGLAFLVRAIALLRDRGNAVSATLHGEGDQRGELEALIAKLNVGDRVTLAGPLEPASALRAALNDADVFCMAHLTNDFGRAFFDAMAAALPVVAFRSIASQDTVRDGVDGLLCANADPEALASAIARLAQDRNLLSSLSHAARARGLTDTRRAWNELRAQHIRELF